MNQLIVAKARLREKFSGEIISKSVDKAKRWMIKAYGEVDWEGLEAECGIFETLETYCVETQAEPRGMVTFNREAQGKKGQI